MENINPDSQYLLYLHNGKVIIKEGEVQLSHASWSFKKNGIVVGSHFKSLEGKTYVKVPDEPLKYACRHLWCYGRDIEQGFEIVNKSIVKRDFFDELKNKYTVEDFSGHIGMILDKDYPEDPDDPKDLKQMLKEAWDFMNELYNIAVKHM